MDWNALIGLDPRESAEKMGDLTTEMGAALEDRPEIAQQLPVLLERELGGKADTETFTPVWEGITTLFGIGDDASRLFSWLSVPEQQERLEALTARCSPALAQLLRNSVALHGKILQDSYRRWREYPDNWDAMHRQTYVDNERNQSRVDIRIVKFNDEEVQLTLDARSLMLMVIRLMNSLSLVASGPFTDAEIRELREQSDAFWSAFESNKAEAEAEVADAEADAAAVEAKADVA